MDQKLFFSKNESIKSIRDYKRIFLVCGDSSYKHIGERIVRDLKAEGVEVSRYGNFNPNPTTDELDGALKKFKEADYDAIMAIGGGSAIDIAKCIKLYGQDEKPWSERFKEGAEALNIPLISVPTTAGSGSEATRFAVLYYNGVKQSIKSDDILPDIIYYDRDVLDTLPDYQKKSTVLDALCQCIESYWSVNSTEESKGYAKEGMRFILSNIDDYIGGVREANEQMQRAAYLSGKAINITQTTAGHAMSYKLTSKYGIAHGHAVALCIYELWPWMIRNKNECVDQRGSGYLNSVFRDLAQMFEADDPMDGCKEFQGLVDDLDMIHPAGDNGDIEELTDGVNTTRLSNNPVKLSYDDITKLYKKILW